jgi:hypothetical protein
MAEVDKNMDFLIRLCMIERLYTYETALIILQTLNYSQEKFKENKQLLNLIFEQIEQCEKEKNNSIKINYI